MDPERAGQETDPAVRARRVGQEEGGAPPAVAAVLAGAGLSAACLVLAALIGPPYLDFSSLNPFVAAFAATSFATLFAVPFAANGLLVRSRPERAEGWETAMLVWAGAALVLVFLAGLLVLPGDFSGTKSLADAAGLVLLVESGLVLVVLGVWILAG